MKSGDRVNALYLSRTSGTCLAMNREVLSVTPRVDGQLQIVVSLPEEATPRQGTYTVSGRGESDYITKADPMSPGYYLQCCACDGEVFVTEDQWNDPTVHLVGHEGCPYDTGADLDHARRHAD